MPKLTVKLVCGVLIMLIVTVSASACATETAEPEYANQITESALQGVNDCDFAKFTEYFSPSTKMLLSDVDFYETCENVKNAIGDYIDKDFWKVETTEEGYTAVYYKAKFSDEPDDVIVRVYFEEKGGETYIYGFWLSSPKLDTLATSTTPTGE